MKSLILLVPFLLLLGCIDTGSSGNVLSVKVGDSVAVDYVGSLTDGKVFDTSIRVEAVKAGLPLRPSYSPLGFTVGAGQMIKGFDSAVIGMKVGETKTVTIPAADAYGESKPNMVENVPRQSIQGNLTIGTELQGPTGLIGRIVSLNATSVTVDFNHELAGKTLVFKITMVNVTRSG